MKNLLWISALCGLLPSLCIGQNFEQNDQPALHDVALGNWQLDNIDNQAPYGEPTLIITHTNIYGHTGCNRLFTSIRSFEAGQWDIHALKMTEKLCSEILSSQEEKLIQGFESNPNITINTENDVLTFNTHQTTLVYRKVN